MIARAVALAACAAAFAAPPVFAQGEADDEEWIALFNGRDLDDWIVKIRRHPVGLAPDRKPVLAGHARRS